MRGWENCQAAVVSRELPDLKAAPSFSACPERSHGSADAPTGRGATNRTWTVRRKQPRKPNHTITLPATNPLSRLSDLRLKSLASRGKFKMEEIDARNIQNHRTGWNLTQEFCRSYKGSSRRSSQDPQEYGLVSGGGGAGKDRGRSGGGISGHAENRIQTRKVTESARHLSDGRVAK